MKRRRFITAIAAAPAIPALVAQQPAPVVPAAPAVPAAVARAGRGGSRGAVADVPKIPVVEIDEAGVTTARYFSAPQLAALRRLAGQLLPPVKSNIGALDCDAVEFLDFLIAQSPADRQQLLGT
jgi:hypothetical protein